MNHASMAGLHCDALPPARDLDDVLSGLLEEEALDEVMTTIDTQLWYENKDGKHTNTKEDGDCSKLLCDALARAEADDAAASANTAHPTEYFVAAVPVPASANGRAPALTEPSSSCRPCSTTRAPTSSVSLPSPLPP